MSLAELPSRDSVPFPDQVAPANQAVSVLKEQARPPAPINESATLLSLIQRAASDTSIDLDRMERLYKMYETAENRRAEQAFNASMAAAQAELVPVAKNARNSHTNSNYADLAAVHESAMPVINKHGFGLSFSEFQSLVEGCFGIICEVTHASGFSKRYEFNIPLDGAGLRGNANKTAVQTYGSTMTYGRRYATLGLFNIALKDDRDGNGAVKPLPGSQQGSQADNGTACSDVQLKKVQELITETGTPIDSVLKYFSVPSLADLSKGQASKAIAMLLQKKQGVGSK